uniref:Calmodulin-lysine N-methyltransferase n=1 Tax=Minutocellus polymorphus TaxID=265543 RepID=A0A7S0FUW5_9STRA
MYDIIFACDVFVYIGCLNSIFASAKNSLATDGTFAFSTECLEESQAEEKGFILHRSARFAHKRSYIESLATKHGFRIVAIKTCPIRKNEGKDVKGILAVFS